MMQYLFSGQCVVLGPSLGPEASYGLGQAATTSAVLLAFIHQLYYQWWHPSASEAVESCQYECVSMTNGVQASVMEAICLSISQNS